MIEKDILVINIQGDGGRRRVAQRAATAIADNISMLDERHREIHVILPSGGGVVASKLAGEFITAFPGHIMSSLPDLGLIPSGRNGVILEQEWFRAILAGLPHRRLIWLLRSVLKRS